MQATGRPVVELYIRCENLKNLDILTKSDPKVIFYTGDNSGKWIKQGETEVIMNNLNPKFTTTFKLEYMFEIEQRLQFVVMDSDSDNMTEDDFLGSCQTTLAKIMAKGTLKEDLLSKRGNVHGQIFIYGEVLSSANETVTLTLRGRKLAKKDFGLFAKSDPYFIIQRESGNIWHDVYKSEIIMRDLNPVWKTFTVPSSKLGSDRTKPFRVIVYDWDQFTAHDLIGMCTTTLEELDRCSRDGGHLRLLDDKNKNGGDLLVTSFKIERQYTFMDYIHAGCEISLVVAVDFTGSNGNPRSANSLHYINPNASVLNEYQSAIWSIGNILAPYDSDQLFPVFGFGAKLPNGTVSHCFSLNGNPSNPECYGVHGILQAYHQAISNVELYGPTNFATFINETVNRYSGPAAENRDSLKYFVLLVLTDGEITDMKDTLASIVRATQTPLSIVIVGVGAADFKNMEILDGDDGELRKSANFRDIVQFVPYRAFSRAGPAQLASETLKEIPAQLEQYMKMKGINPTNYNRTQANHF